MPNFLSVVGMILLIEGMNTTTNEYEKVKEATWSCKD
jgi:hypothetical protein